MSAARLRHALTRACPVAPILPSPGLLPRRPFPSSSAYCLIKSCCLLLSVACGEAGRDLEDWGGAVRLPETAEAALEVLALVSPPRADWLTRWAQDGPGAGPFKDLGTKAVAVCCPDRCKPSWARSSSAASRSPGGWGGLCFLDRRLRGTNPQRSGDHGLSSGVSGPAGIRRTLG